jgi:hypothetical protein
MDIALDREFLAVAARRLGHLIPNLPEQPSYGKRRAADRHDRLADGDVRPRLSRLIVCDKGYAETVSASNATAPLADPRHCRGIESIFWTLKARGLHGLRARTRRSCSHSPPASGSTTTSTSPPAPSHTSPPNGARNQSSRRRAVEAGAGARGRARGRAARQPHAPRAQGAAVDRRGPYQPLDRPEVVPIRSHGRISPIAHPPRAAPLFAGPTRAPSARSTVGGRTPGSASRCSCRNRTRGYGPRSTAARETRARIRVVGVGAVATGLARLAANASDQALVFERSAPGRRPCGPTPAVTPTAWLRDTGGDGQPIFAPMLSVSWKRSCRPSGVPAGRALDRDAPAQEVGCDIARERLDDRGAAGRRAR